jgi:hypothetical protein
VRHASATEEREGIDAVATSSGPIARAVEEALWGGIQVVFLGTERCALEIGANASHLPIKDNNTKHVKNVDGSIVVKSSIPLYPFQDNQALRR